MKKLLVAVLALSTASVALADRRGANEPYIPVDTLNGTGSVNGDVFSFSARVENTRGEELVCALFAQGQAKKQGTTTTVDVTKYVKGMYIEMNQDNQANFQFRNANFGDGFKLSRTSIKAFASCQGASNDDGSGGAGNCDPRSPGQNGRYCDNTCRADKNDPSQCGRKPNGKVDDFFD